MTNDESDLRNEVITAMAKAIDLEKQYQALRSPKSKTVKSDNPNFSDSIIDNSVESFAYDAKKANQIKDNSIEAWNKFDQAFKEFGSKKGFNSEQWDQKLKLFKKELHVNINLDLQTWHDKFLKVEKSQVKFIDKLKPFFQKLSAILNPFKKSNSITKQNQPYYEQTQNVANNANQPKDLAQPKQDKTQSENKQYSPKTNHFVASVRQSTYKNPKMLPSRTLISKKLLEKKAKELKSPNKN